MKTGTATVEAKPLIAIVDDDDSVRTSTARVVRSFGFRTEEYVSARDFLTSPSAAQTACLLLDLRMPVMDGLALQRCLISLSCDVPVIVVTGNADHAEQRLAMQNGAADFLRKPVGMLVLVSAIAEALRRHRAARSRVAIPAHR